jgi:transposase-like protein/IS1 family transposase
MTCHNCQIVAVKIGKDRKGVQRYLCKQCRKTYRDHQEKPLDKMRLPMEKALLVLKLLVEGNSVRSTERITGVEKKTILSLLVLTGEKCERLLTEKIKDVPVRDVQADEMWGFVGMKQKTAYRLEKTSATTGDAWTYVAIERHSKLILAWHLCHHRSARATVEFTEKIYHATSGRFQLTTDGLPTYPEAIAYSLGTRCDYAQLIKVFAPTRGEKGHYSPPEVVGITSIPRSGNPDEARICTSHVERQNLTMRMMMRRLTRLTNGFSKKWENLKAALALHFAYYNFCRIHKTLRCTPAMEAGITKRVWELKDLLAV